MLFPDFVRRCTSRSQPRCARTGHLGTGRNDAREFLSIGRHLFIAAQLGGTHEQCGIELEIVRPQIEPAEDIVRGQSAQQIRGWNGKPQGLFVKDGPLEQGLDAGYLAQQVAESCGVGMAGGGDPFQSFGTQQGHVDGGGGYQQPLVGADVRGRLGAADVLLAGL